MQDWHDPRHCGLAYERVAAGGRMLARLVKLVTMASQHPGSLGCSQGGSRSTWFQQDRCGLWNASSGEVSMCGCCSGIPRCVRFLAARHDTSRWAT
jgi:hypothetical protein